MNDKKKSAFSADQPRKPRVRLLIFGRLALIIVLCLAGWWWSYGLLGFETDPAPFRLFLLFVTYSLLTCFYLLFRRYNRSIRWQIRTQFAIDVLAITWLVWGTGGINSPYITLYVFLISAAGFYLIGSSVHIVAASCTLSFTLLTFSMAPSLNYSITGEVAPSRSLQFIAFNDAAFLLVGLLASRLAARRRIADELVKAEADFADLNVLHSRILESIKSGLITTDLQGKIYSFNRAAEEISGRMAADVMGENVFAVLGDEIRSAVGISLSGVRSVEFSAPYFESGIQKINIGKEIFAQTRLACSVSPLIGKSGGVTGLIIAFQDVTEMEAMEETLRRSDRLAAVGRLAAGLAHEIRNPLGSMSSALQFLSEKARPNTEEAALMSVVLRESDRLNRIITDFLTYARPKSIANGSPSDHSVNVCEAMSDCLVLLRHDPAVCDLHTFVFEPPEAAISVQASETQIKQIFWNLLQNAIQAMPDGGEVTAEFCDVPDSRLAIIVSDTGSGIIRENLERIFEPFQSGATGTGLGLSIVHKLVTELGGEIDVQSEVGKGTRIILDLPKHI